MLLVGPDLLKAYDREAKGVPIGRPAEVNLRNNHSQYIFTWLVSPYYPQLLSFAGESVFETMKLILCLSRYALSAATTIMLWMVVRKPPSEVARRIGQNKNW